MSRNLHLLPSVLALACTATGQNWSIVTQASPPPGRALAAVECEPSPLTSTLMFGGFRASSPYYLGDTWRWTGTTWVQLFPVNSPSPRCASEMISSPYGSTLVLYGGVGTGVVGDTWTWDGTNWTLVNAGLAPGITSPSVTSGGAMAYDVVRGKVVLFGGMDVPGTSGVIQNQTWEFDVATSTWSRILTNTVPAGRLEAQMAYDFARGKCVMFGGKTTPNTQVAETWVYNGVDWTQLFPDNAPCNRSGEDNMAYDWLRNVVVLHSGNAEGPPGNECSPDQTWEWDGNDWYLAYSTSLPLGTGQSGSIGWCGANNSIVHFGGFPPGGATPLSATNLYGGQLPYFSTFGAGCVGTVGAPLLVPTSLPAIGGTFAFDVTNLPPSPGVVAIAIGLGKIQPGLDLGFVLGLPGCRLYATPDILNGVLAPAGSATYSLLIPTGDPTWIGLGFYCQALSIEGSGVWAISNAGYPRAW